MNSIDYLLLDINNIKGIGSKTSKLFKKKNINTIFDFIWNIPRDLVDRSNLTKINELKIGSIETIRCRIEHIECSDYYCEEKQPLTHRYTLVKYNGTLPANKIRLILYAPNRNIRLCCGVWYFSRDIYVPKSYV